MMLSIRFSLKKKNCFLNFKSAPFIIEDRPPIRMTSSIVNRLRNVSVCEKKGKVVIFIREEIADFCQMVEIAGSWFLRGQD